MTTISGAGAHAAFASTDRFPVSKAGVKGYLTGALLAEAMAKGTVPLAAGTITTSQPLTITQTLNNGAVTFNSLLINLTDTASNAASTFADFQIAGVSKIAIKKDGTIAQRGSAIGFLQFTSTEVDADVVNWKSYYNRFTFTNGGAGSDTYYDHVYAAGFNVSSIGVREYTDRPYLARHLESKFSQGGGGPYASEYLLHFMDVTGAVHRQNSYFLPHNGAVGTGGSILSEAVDKIVWYDWGGTSRAIWTINSGGSSFADFSNSFKLRFAVNNIATCQQRNGADSAFLNLPFYNAENRLQVESSISIVGATPTTGTYANVFAAWQATTLPANGIILDITGPSVTGSAMAAQMAATVTADWVFGLYNNNNATGSHAILELRTIGTGAGDPKIYFHVNGGSRWQYGLDNSASDQMVWALDSLGVGGLDKMTLDTSGNLGFVGYQQMIEVTAPSAGASNSARIYAEDNGSGKTRLMAIFATGAAQQIAIQP